MVKVLFVCVGNASRSQIAEAYARHHGAGVLAPYSTGTRPSAHLNARVESVLTRRGLDVSDARPKSVDEVPPGPYEWMIRMGCGDVLLVPALHREDWDLPRLSTLSDDDLDALCDDLEVRVLDFIERARVWASVADFPLLAPEPPGPPPAAGVILGDGQPTSDTTFPLLSAPPA
jgi:protein-tyrosine-phosphatase